MNVIRIKEVKLPPHVLGDQPDEAVVTVEWIVPHTQHITQSVQIAIPRDVMEALVDFGKGYST